MSLVQRLASVQQSSTLINRPTNPQENFRAMVKMYSARMQQDLGIKGFHADGIFGNLGEESRGMTAMQETGMKAGRGGLGWAQWTGPRRVNYEKFLQAHGFSAWDAEANYLFFIQELKASYGKALAALKRTRTRDAACVSWMNNYEVPGVPAEAVRKNWARIAEQARVEAEGEAPAPGPIPLPPPAPAPQQGPTFWSLLVALFSWLFKGPTGTGTVVATPSTRTPSVPNEPAIPTPSTASIGTILKRLWGHAAAPPASPLPSEVTKGDPVVFRVQTELLKRGYSEVGWVDGQMGKRTRAAIMAARRENGLPRGDSIDQDFLAALPTMPARAIDPKRAEITGTDLKRQGQPAANNFGIIGTVMKWVVGGGLLGGVDQSGLLDAIKNAFGSAGDAADSVHSVADSVAPIVTSIVNGFQWCLHHWWIFAIVIGFYVLLHVSLGILDLVIKFRQGFLTHPGA